MILTPLQGKLSLEMAHKYRVPHLFVHLGCVDLELEYSAVCLNLPGLVEFDKTGWATEQDKETFKFLVNPTYRCAAR